MTIDRALVDQALGAYEVGGELGRGASGIVLRGVHRHLGRDVAIKQLPRAFGADPAQRRRFLHEAQLLAGMDHPHVVPIFDYVEHEGLCLLVMELLTGGTLWDRMHATMTNQEVCAVGLAAAAGLHCAHELGTLHRDVKPENLMFSARGVLKVTDFGIAKVMGSMTMATQAGFVIGTPAYMAPEQAQGHELSPATDVYALATVLYEVIAGQLPHPNPTDPVSALYQHVHEDAAPLTSVAPTSPEGVCAVIDQALQRAPGDRFASADDFATALQGAAVAAWGPDWLDRTGIPVLSARTGRATGDLPEAPAEPTARPAAPATVVPDIAPSTTSPSTTEPPADPGPPARRGRRVALVAGALAVAAAVAGAVLLTGGSDDPAEDAADPTVSTTTTAPTPAASLADDLAAAPSLLLQLSDVPTGWVTLSDASSGDTPAEVALSNHLAECTGAPEGTFTDADSGPTLADPTQTLTADSSVSVADSAADRFTAFASGSFTDCLETGLQLAGASFDAVTRVEPSSVAGAATAGWTIELTAPDSPAVIYQEAVVLQRGRFLYTLTITSIGEPFPTPLADSLIENVGRRLSATT